MECYMCNTYADIKVHTPCCFKPVCKLCATDFQDAKCPCDNMDFRSSFHLIKFSKKKTKLGNIIYEFKNKKREWNTWVDEAKTCLWKLPIPLDDYINIFNKNVKLYNENLQSAEDLISAKKYVDGLNQFRYSSDDRLPGRIIKNKKGQKVVTSYQFIDFFEKNIDKEWNWKELSINPNITIDIIERYPNKPWNWYWLSQNPNINIDIVERYTNKEWDWYWLSSNPNITMDIVERYPKKPWNWYGLSKNSNISIDTIESNPNMPWDWSGLSLNPNITIDIVERYPNKPWNWVWLSKNPNITIDIIELNPNMPWDWCSLSSNQYF